jgi:hypothetical protein
MKAIGGKYLLRWCALALAFAAVIGLGIYKVVSGREGVSESYGLNESFEEHVTICTRFPSSADFRWMARPSDESIGELLQKDKFAYDKFTESFSDPVRVSVKDNGALFYLSRVWKANEGYLILTSGRDPMDYELHIRYVNEMPRMNEPFEEAVGMTTVTAEFLEDYEVVMIPIGPRGVSVQQTDSSYSINGRIVEQGGAGQPATRPDSDSEGGDEPQPESEGCSR